MLTGSLARVLQRPPLARLGRLFFHTSHAYCSPRKRPGTRNPLPEEEIRKRVEEIMYRTRKKPKPKDHIDYDFAKVGNYRIKDEKIQKLYKEYLRLYHPELAGDDVPNKEVEDCKSKEAQATKAIDMEGSKDKGK